MLNSYPKIFGKFQTNLIVSSKSNAKKKWIYDKQENKQKTNTVGFLEKLWPFIFWSTWIPIRQQFGLRMCFPANHVITRILFVREMEVFYIPSTDTPAANIPWQSVSPCCQGAKNRTFPLPAIQDSVLANAKLENITSECKKLTQLLIINPIWARTTQIRTLIQMQTRENIHDDGVGSTWKNVMVEVSLGTVGKWDDKYEWRTQSKGNELWGLRVTQEKEKSRGEKKLIEECEVEGKIWQKMERKVCIH